MLRRVAVHPVRVTRDKDATRRIKWPFRVNFDQRKSILAFAGMHVVVLMACFPVDDLRRQQDVDLVQIPGMFQNRENGHDIEAPAKFERPYGELANTGQPRCAVQPKHHLGYTRVDAEHVRLDIS